MIIGGARTRFRPVVLTTVTTAPGFVRLVLLRVGLPRLLLGLAAAASSELAEGELGSVGLIAAGTRVERFRLPPA